MLGPPDICGAQRADLGESKTRAISFPTEHTAHGEDIQRAVSRVFSDYEGCGNTHTSSYFTEFGTPTSEMLGSHLAES